MKLRMKKHNKVIKNAFIPKDEKIVFSDFITEDIIKIITICNKTGYAVFYRIKYDGMYSVIERSVKI